MNTIDIKHSYLLPLTFRIFGGILILFGILVQTSIESLAIGLLTFFCCAIAGILLLTSRYGIQINCKGKKYKEYVKILGAAKGTWKPYNTIEKIFINPVKSSQTIYATRSNHRTDIVRMEYIAFLKLENGIKIQLDEDTSKERLLARISGYNTVLKTTITDNT